MALTLATNSPATATATGVSLETFDTNILKVIINSLYLTQKTNVIVSAWITGPNGTIFYRAVPQNLSPLSAGDNVSILITDSPNNYLGSDQLYTTGGEIENIVTPATTAIWNYQAGMMLVNSENPFQVWYSQEIIPQLPAEFNNSFTIQVDEQDGILYGGAQTDGNCVLFKANSVYYFTGQGPSPNGSSNDFTTPQRIAADTGSTNPRSIVLHPLRPSLSKPQGNLPPRPLPARSLHRSPSQEAPTRRYYGDFCSPDGEIQPSSFHNLCWLRTCL